MAARSSCASSTGHVGLADGKESVWMGLTYGPTFFNTLPNSGNLSILAIFHFYDYIYIYMGERLIDLVAIHVVIA